MRSEDVFEFDPKAYRHRIRSEYNDHDLRDNIYTKRREIVSGTSGMVVGAGTMNAFSVGYNARCKSVAEQKLKILEREWARRGHHPLSERTRDTVMGLARTATMGLI